MDDLELSLQLEQGALPLAPNTFGIRDLSQQLFALAPAVDSHGAVVDAGLGTDLKAKLDLGHRLLALAGGAAAARRSLVVEQMGQTLNARVLRRRLIADRDALVALAHDRGVDPGFFRLAFKRGDTSNLVSAALAFRELVRSHAPKLGDTPFVRSLVDDVTADVDAIVDAERVQEERKRDVLQPTAVRTRARHALYAVLLHISRNGCAVFRRDEKVREAFRLKVLHKPASARKKTPVAPDVLSMSLPSGAVRFPDG